MTGAWIYRTLVGLHPRSFRERFGPQMLSVFDEADTGEISWLLLDCLISLLRQRVLRSGCRRFAAAGLAATAQTALVSAAWPLMTEWALRPLNKDGPVSGELLLLISGILTALLMAATILAVMARRALRPARPNRRPARGGAE